MCGSARRFAQDDDFFAGLKHPGYVCRKHEKIEKVTGSQDDGFVRGSRNSRLVVRKTRKVEKVTGSRDDKGEGGASIWCDGSSDRLADLVHFSLNLPQASLLLGMTKGRGASLESGCWIKSAVHHLGWAARPKMKNAFSLASALYGSAPLPFVIPSAAEGSAVPRITPGNISDRAQRLQRFAQLISPQTSKRPGQLPGPLH